MALEIFDDIYLVDEERYLKLGLSNKLRLLITVFTDNTETNSIRIISSRIATKNEANLYEKRI